MTQTDRQGLALTTTVPAAAAYREGITLLLSAWPGALDAFDAAVADDPGFALGHIARARVLQMQARMPEARAAAAQAQSHVAGATAREQSHTALVAGLVDGQSPAVLAALPAHLDRWPGDALALSLALGAFGLYAFSGMADHDAARVALCRRHADAYAGDWWFEGYLGWSLTEAGALDEGAEHTARSLSLRPANANAAHAMAHSLFERGGAAEAFIEGWLPGYPTHGVLHGHISWHLALAALERGDTARARALFDDRLRPDIAQAPPLNTFTDAASLLWRLMLEGEAVEMAPVADYGAARFANPGLAFADVHAALADALAGRQAALDARIGAIGPPHVAALCRGAAAFAAQDWQAAIAHWRPVLPEAVRIGGSHAQRELFEDSFIQACLRGGAEVEARAMLNARLARRPSARDARWLG